MNVGIFVFDGADELDVVGPFRVFAAVDANVSLVAGERGRVRLGNGLLIEVADDFDSSPPLDVHRRFRPCRGRAAVRTQGEYPLALQGALGIVERESGPDARRLAEAALELETPP